jgi:MipA family protein
MLNFQTMTSRHLTTISSLLCCLLFSLSPTLAGAPETRPLTVRVAGDFPMVGNMTVKVFQSLELFRAGRPLAETNLPVDADRLAITFPDIPDGNYLLSVSHDANLDGKMNANAFGVPTESSAFYTPVPRPGRIRPAEAFFDLGAENRELDVTLFTPPASPRAWGAGAIVLLSSNPYRGGDFVVRAFPSLSFVGERLFLVGPRGGLNLYRSPWLNVNLNAEFKFAGDAFEDQPFLAGMEKRRDTVMSGFDASLRALGPWRVELSAQTDVLDRHNGQQVDLSFSRNWRGRQWSIAPGAGVVWRSSSYNDYYFGVRENEATADRPAYDPGDSIELLARVFGRYEFNDRWSLLASLRLEFLSEDVQDSPIVDKEQVIASFIGFNYAF